MSLMTIRVFGYILSKKKKKQEEERIQSNANHTLVENIKFEGM